MVSKDYIEGRDISFNVSTLHLALNRDQIAKLICVLCYNSLKF